MMNKIVSNPSMLQCCTLWSVIGLVGGMFKRVWRGGGDILVGGLVSSVSAVAIMLVPKSEWSLGGCSMEC